MTSLVVEWSPCLVPSIDETPLRLDLRTLTLIHTLLNTYAGEHNSFEEDLRTAFRREKNAIIIPFRYPWPSTILEHISRLFYPTSRRSRSERADRQRTYRATMCVQRTDFSVVWNASTSENERDTERKRELFKSVLQLSLKTHRHEARCVKQHGRP